MTTNSLRPGVFSSYTVTSSAVSGASAQYAAVCARAVGGEKAKLYRFTRYADAAEIFTGGAMLAAVDMLLRMGVSQVVCAPASVTAAEPAAEDYDLAFGAVAEAANIGAVLCDSGDAQVQAALLASVKNVSCKAFKERIAIMGAEDAETAAARAAALNDERACLCFPKTSFGGVTSGFMTACAFAGMLLTSPVDKNLSGESCAEISLADAALTEAGVQTLLAAGVTVFEEASAAPECVKAITTRTRTGGETDYSLASVATVRIIDQILQRARATMKILLKNAKNTSGTLQSMAAQMTVLLASAVDEGLLRGFEAPRVYPLATDAEVCVVELAFTAASAVNQIHIVAHISL